MPAVALCLLYSQSARRGPTTMTTRQTRSSSSRIMSACRPPRRPISAALTSQTKQVRAGMRITDLWGMMASKISAMQS
eukprot:747580-Hanusia_phi.AAC.3